MVEADGHFGVKYRIAKSKSESRKRAISESVHILFRLDQRSYDIPTNTSMIPIMGFIASNLNCNLSTYKYKTSKPNEIREALSLSITSLNLLKPLIVYFNTYPLRGNKYKDFLDWEKIYYLMLSKEHLTELGVR